jgi:hypothetical protein
MQQTRNTWNGLVGDTGSGGRYRATGGIFLHERSPSQLGSPTIREPHPAIADLRTGIDRNLFLGNGALRIALHLDAEAEAVRDLMSRYSNIPMSLADACVVRLAEISGLPVCTLDSDFTIYRANGRKRLGLIIPENQG